MKLKIIGSVFAGVGFLLLVSSALAADSNIFFTNKNGDKVTQFTMSDEVYIEGFCPAAGGAIIKIYILNDGTWEGNGVLSDVSGGIETVSVGNDSMIPRTKIWGMPYDGMFDVAIDANNDLTLQPFECSIGLAGMGLRIGNPAPAPVIISAPAPTPVQAPVIASPPAPSKPSEDFEIDSYVEVKSLSNVRSTPGGSLLGQQSKGEVGVVVGGPVEAFSGGVKYWFWHINFHNNPDGWVAETTLKSIPPPKVVEKKSEPKPTPTPEVSTASAVNTETAAVAAPTGTEKAVAQASDTGISNSLMSALIIGISILLGFVFGSFIIARALKRS